MGFNSAFKGLNILFVNFTGELSNDGFCFWRYSAVHRNIFL